MNDVEAIEQNQATFVERGNVGDVDGVMAACTEDVVMMPPNAPMIVGADAVRSWLSDFLEQFTADLSTTTEKLEVAGDLAYARRAFAWTLTPKLGGPSIRESGKTVIVYRRDTDGAWKVAVDIWNTDTPASVQ